MSTDFSTSTKRN